MVNLVQNGGYRNPPRPPADSIAITISLGPRIGIIAAAIIGRVGRREKVLLDNFGVQLDIQAFAVATLQLPVRCQCQQSFDERNDEPSDEEE